VYRSVIGSYSTRTLILNATPIYLLKNSIDITSSLFLDRRLVYLELVKRLTY